MTALMSTAEIRDEPVRVLAVDRNPLIRTGLRRLLERSGAAEVVGEARHGLEALHVVQRLDPDVVILGGALPHTDELNTLSKLAHVARVVMLAHDATPDLVVDAVRRGAISFLVHGDFDPDHLRRVVVDAHAERSHLSPCAASALIQHVVDAGRPHGLPRVSAEFGLSAREAEVMTEIARGMSNAEIAALLVLSEKTIKNHVNAIFRKLSVRSRATAVAVWLGTAGRRPEQR